MLLITRSKLASLFHLKAPGRRPTARRAGGRDGAHSKPHPGCWECADRELRGGRVLVNYQRRGKRLFIIYLDGVARRAAHVRPVEGDARARAEARISRGADERWRRQRASGRGCDGQRRRAAYAAVSCGDRDSSVRGDGRGINGEGRTRGACRHGDAGRH